MKLRFSTFVLSIALICTLLGWIVERKLNNRKTLTLLSGAETHTSVTNANLLPGFKQNEDENQLDRLLVDSVFQLYLGAENVDYYLENDGSASRLANESLKILGCKSVDEYFVKFRSNYQSDKFLIFGTEGTEEHNSFHIFVSKCLL